MQSLRGSAYAMECLELSMNLTCHCGEYQHINSTAGSLQRKVECRKHQVVGSQMGILLESLFELVLFK